jgi:uncharacterized protein YyaL (SSP411 family)
MSENLLRHETSPYLLQHAENPVHWRPWGQAALAEAQAAKKPILLSVGYAACHWCHVMAHESFEDPATAALMNELYVNIKVDREERPDIDHLYMSALHALGEQGGWPLTMFLTPDGSPFWGGTYFPPEPRWGKPSFRQVLQGVAETFSSDDERITHNTKALRQALVALSTAKPGPMPVPTDLDRVAAAFQRITDPIHGGLRGAPKFPNPPIFRFLWQNDFRTGRRNGRDATHLMLERMSEGGIYDHLGGGFSRYSTDEVWLVPHFEKMLYDNAQLLELLALAHADRPDPLYAERATETVGWLTRDMTAARANGRAAFASAEDADSEGVEGKFYVWSEAEVVGLLGLAAPGFMAAYDVTEHGNWEETNILRRITPRGDAGQEARLAAGRATLFAARAGRTRPGRDDKVLADWNGLAIAALARAGAVFGRPDWTGLAEEALDFVLDQMTLPDGRIQHAWRLGRITAPGMLEDQAAIARAALALFEATGNQARLEQACRIVRATEENFYDGHGAFYQTAADAADVPLNRPRSAADNATPAGNGQMAEVLARLFHLTGDEAFRSAAAALLGAFTGEPEKLAALPTLLAAADLLEDATTVVVAGDPSEKSAATLCQTALTSPDPRVVLLRAPRADALPASHPAHGKTAGAAGASAYVCRGGVCGLPMDDPAELRRILTAP